MVETQQISGQCLCGAVRISATATDPVLRACHCDMCRRHTSSMFISLPTDPDSQIIEGPAKSFRSSEWAERGFCDVCGSTLWYGTLHDGVKNLAAGLFENAVAAPLKMEFFVDQCPQGYTFAGDHKRLTKQQTIAMFASDEGDYGQ